MAQAKVEIIDALRRTAKKLGSGNDYMWGHMGSCNCGNLAQEITKRSKAEIHAYAMQGHGDWNEQLNDYCGITQMPIDLVIHEMLTSGFSLDDLQNLEKFASQNGAKFYNLPYNQERITLRHRPTSVPQELNFGSQILVPLCAGVSIEWSIEGA